MKLLQNKTLDASLCDTEAKLSVVGASQIVEDAITEMMSRQKIDGITTSKKYGAVWVFTKNRIIFKKIAHWTDKINIECFLATKSLVKMTAQTVLKDENGDMIAVSSLEMCALDQKAEKIKKVADVGIDEKIKFYGVQYPIEFAKNSVIDLEKVDTVLVKSTNIDYCHHTNNVEYLRFLMNTYSVDELEKNRIKEIEISYINQSFEKETLEIYRKSEKNKDIFEIRNGDKKIVKGEIVFDM